MSFDIITVKFHFNETETVVQVYNSEEYISTILKDIAEKFILPTKYLALHSDENQKRLSGNLQLNEICQNDFGIIDLKLELSELAHDINARKIDNDKIKISSDIYYRFVLSSNLLKYFRYKMSFFLEIFICPISYQ